MKPTKVALLHLFLLFTVTVHAAAGTARSAGVSSGDVSAAELREDLRYLQSQLRSSHYDVYARRPKADYDERFEQAVASLKGTYTKRDTQIIVQELLAYGNVAHNTTALPVEEWAAFRKAGGKFFPLRLRVVGDRVYVLDVLKPDTAIAPGAEVVGVDGVPILNWLAEPRSLLSADTDYFGYALLEDSLQEMNWYRRGASDKVKIGLRSANGEVQVVETAGATAADEAASLAGRKDATWAQWTERQFRWLPGKIAYLRPGPFYDNRPDAKTMWDPAVFRAFIETAFARINKRRAEALIIDLRNNPGGDSSFSDRLIERIATKPFAFASAFRVRVSEAAKSSNAQRLAAAPTNQNVQELARLFETAAPGSIVSLSVPLVEPAKQGRFDGPVFVIVNRHSYSNTVFVAATIQDYGFGTIVGEETADLASTYGAMEAFTLPHSGLTVSFPKARIVRPNGNDDERGVVPDIPIASPLVRTDVDYVLDETIKLIRSRAGGEHSSAAGR